MDDPWKNIDSTVSARLEISEDRCTNFSDSFCPQSVETTDVDSSKLPFEKLPDSSQYLANLGVLIFLINGIGSKKNVLHI